LVEKGGADSQTVQGDISAVSSLYATGDPITISLIAILLVLLVLMVALPSMVAIIRNLTHVPFRTATLRWLYVAWVIILLSELVYNIDRDARLSATQAGADNFIRLAFLLLGLFTILLIGSIYRFVFIKELMSGVLGISFAFALWNLISTLWSVFPTLTFYKSVEYLVTVLLFAFAVFLIRVNARNSPNQLLALKSLFDWNWFLTFSLLVTVYLGVLILPQRAIVPVPGVVPFALEGVLPGISANAVGELSAILGIVAVTRMALKAGPRFLYLPLFSFSMITMVLAQSRSPIAAFSVALVVVLLLSRRFGWLALVVSSLIVVLLSGYSEVVYAFFRRGQSIGVFKSLSGRTGYWEASLDAVRESPIGGFGGYAGGRYVTQATLGEDDMASTVHSAYVETLIGTGIVGLTILLILLLSTWFWLFRLRSFATRTPIGHLLWVESVGVFSVLMVRTLFSVPIIWGQILTFGLFLVFISVMRKQAIPKNHEVGTVVQPARPVRQKQRY
jgi:O-antigen ligase